MRCPHNPHTFPQPPYEIDSFTEKIFYLHCRGYVHLSVSKITQRVRNRFKRSFQAMILGRTKVIGQSQCPGGLIINQHMYTTTVSHNMFYIDSFHQVSSNHIRTVHRTCSVVCRLISYWQFYQININILSLKGKDDLLYLTSFLKLVWRSAVSQQAQYDNQSAWWCH